MGTPVSWPLLCLMNLFWSSEAWTSYYAQGDQQRPTFKGNFYGVERPEYTPRLVICGDDLAALWPTYVCNKYEEIA